MADITIVQADLARTEHQEAVVAMLDAYARDPMGDAQPLSDYARTHLVAGLQGHPTTLVLLVFADQRPVGIATCFGGFSTFAARPLLNISDFYVAPELRGQGLGRALLAAIEAEARRRGCCRLTLEVQQNNSRARAIYGDFGFAQAVYPADANGGGSLYLVKPLG